MVQRPAALGAFEFVVLSTLRAAQLLRGCIPTIDPGDHRAAVTAQLEVASGRVMNTSNGHVIDGTVPSVDGGSDV